MSILTDSNADNVKLVDALQELPPDHQAHPYQNGYMYEQAYPRVMITQSGIHQDGKFQHISLKCFERGYAKYISYLL